MPDPVTTVGIGVVAAYVGKDIVLKILGPTADYLGGELKEFTQRRMVNVGRIFSNAEKKLCGKLNSPGQVPPKVLKTIINEGSYADDVVAVEYFGGVLASSRTEVSRDDRGARIAKIIDNMSAYQMRTHYLIYSTIAQMFSHRANSFNLTEDRVRMQLFMPFQGFAIAMDFTQQEWDNPQILTHIFHGLSTDGLIEIGWAYGNQEILKTHGDNVPGDGIVCTPSALGVELFLWAFGYGDKELNFLLRNDSSLEIVGVPQSVPNAAATKDTSDETQESPSEP